MPKPKPMTTKTALALAVLVLEWEAENTDINKWRNECKQAAAALAEFSPPPAPEWVQRDDTTLNSSNFNLPVDTRKKDNSYNKGHS